MRRVGRAAFYGAVALVWLAAVVAALDLYEAMRWRHVRQTNPFVRALHGQSPWPELVRGRHEASPDAPSTPPPAPETREREPLPDPRKQMDQRADCFVSLEQRNRYVFANRYHFQVLVSDADARVTAAYPYLEFRQLVPDAAVENNTVAVAALLPPQDVDRFRTAHQRVLQTGEGLLDTFSWRLETPQPDGGAPESVLLYPGRSTSGAVDSVYVFIAKPKPADPNSEWDEPFFSYKAHQVRSNEGFQTNNFGFRGPDVAVPKPPGQCRILCVGGSTTEEGESQPQTYPALLEKALNDHFGPGSVQVVNCGVTGLQSCDERVRMADYLALEPDLIVYYHGVNDVCHLLLPRWVNQAAVWQKILRTSRFVRRHFNAWLLPSEDRMAAEMDDFSIDNLRGMQAYARAHNVGMAFCSFAHPGLDRLDPVERQYYDVNSQLEWTGVYTTFESYCRVMDLFNRKLRALCEETGALYIPVAENLQEGTAVFGDVCHMRTIGIEEKAGAIFPYVRDYIERLRRDGASPETDMKPREALAR